MKRVAFVAVLAFLSIILVNNIKAPASILEVTSEPAGATVLVDDVPRGETSESPLKIGLTPGSHSLTVMKDGYEDNYQIVKTTQGEAKKVNIVLKKK